MEQVLRAKEIASDKANKWLNALMANESVEAEVRFTPYYTPNGDFAPFSYVHYYVGNGNMTISVMDGRIRVERTDYIANKRVIWVYNIAE